MKVDKLFSDWKQVPKEIWEVFQSFLRLKQIENIRSDEINDFKVRNLLSKN